MEDRMTDDLLGFDFLNPPQLPREAMKVTGCDCTGGGRMHTTDCALFRLDPEVREQAVQEVETRFREHGEMLNARVRAWQEGQ